MRGGGVEEVVPTRVISSASTLRAAKAKTATTKTTAMIPVRFTFILPGWKHPLQIRTNLVNPKTKRTASTGPILSGLFSFSYSFEESLQHIGTQICSRTWATEHDVLLCRS